MQSYGEISTEKFKSTHVFPTKSAIVGLFGCALGYDRKEVQKLSQLSKDIKIGVRIDRKPIIFNDFQSVNGESVYAEGHIAVDSFLQGNKSISSKNKILNKEYLNDGIFTVVIEGKEDLLLQLRYAIRNPKWVNTLGRYNCIPSVPIFLENDIYYLDTMEEVLKIVPLSRRHDLVDSFEIEVESEDGNYIIWDNIVDDTIIGSYTYGRRMVYRTFISISK